MDYANLNFLALPDEVRRHAENALKSFSGSGTLVFNQSIFDTVGELQQQNHLYGFTIDKEENDVYFLVDDDYWEDLIKNHYLTAFNRGYMKAKEVVASLKENMEQQLYTVFSGVYRVDEQFKMPVMEIDGKQVVLPSTMDNFGFETGMFIGFWDFIFLNPQPFEKLFAEKTIEPFFGKGIKFHGDQIEFLELITALIENKNLKGTRKEIYEACEEFFNVKITYRDKYISDLNTNRNAGQETKFLDKLKTALMNRFQNNRTLGRR